MRVSSNLFYTNFKNDQFSATKQINKLNEQISSGMKIQKGFENSSINSANLRLNSEKNFLSQVKTSVEQSKTFADISDSTLSDFNGSLNKFKTKLIQAANSTVNANGREAIASELEAEKEHLISLANTTFNGKYLFSGDMINTKPIDVNGNYLGNDKSLSTITGKSTKLAYNIDGESLFLGKDSTQHKTLSTNVVLYNKTSDTNEILKDSDTIRDLVGDNNDDQSDDAIAHFYISGTKPNGESFKAQIDLSTDKNVSELLDKIGNSFGNSADQKVVEVNLNDRGQIVIKDLNSGSSKLDFKIVGAIDRDISDVNADDANLNNTAAYTNKDLSNLNNVSNVEIIEFTKSGFSSVDSNINESLQIDQFYFEKKSNILSGNVAIMSGNDFATSSTKLVDSAGVSSLNGESFVMKLTDITGSNVSVELNLDTNNSTFSIGTSTYNIYDASGNVTDGDDFTYGQLHDIISMTLSNELPATTNSSSDYNSAVIDSKKSIDSKINSQGFLEIQDLTNKSSKIKFALYDKASNDFENLSAPSLSFMSNNAITTNEQNINFFKELDEIIDSIRSGRVDMDANETNPRNVGMQNSLLKLEKFMNNFNTQQSRIGAISNSLSTIRDKTEVMELNVVELKSKTIDADLTQSILEFNQLTLNYQALLSTVSKVNSLSLINYLK